MAKVERTESQLLHYNRARIDDTLVNELIGLARGVIADNRLNDLEIKALRKWLAVSERKTNNPLISNLYVRIVEILSDNTVDDEERSELFGTLNALCGGNFELGEVLPSTKFPLDKPPPKVVVENNVFTFTGNFVFGSRKDCRLAVEEKGGIEKNALSKKTDFLVIGSYASEAWIHTSFGRKIENAMGLRKQYKKLAIISESHWFNHL